MPEALEEGGGSPGLAGAGARGHRVWTRLAGRTRAAIVIFILCVVVYTLLLLLVPRYNGMPTTDGDELHYLIITRSLISDRDLSVADNYRDRQYAGFYELPDPMWHVTRANGRLVSTHPAFLSLVVLPGFGLFGYRGAAFTMILFVSFAAVFTFLLADRFVRRGVAAGVTLFMFMSYPLLFYARLIYPETAALFLLALGSWSAWRLKECGRPLYAALGGLSAGLLVLFHPKFIALSGGLLLAFLMVTGLRRSEAKLYLWWAVPAVACLAVLFAITIKSYGPNLVAGLTASGGSKVMGGYLGANSYWGVAGMFLDRAWGLFIFAPLFALFPHGLSLQNNRLEWTRWWAFFPACIAAHVLLLGVFQSWNGGAAPVQRYLVPVASMLAICVALFIERCRSRAAWGVVAALGMWQVVNTVWAFRFMVGTYGMAGTDNIMLEHFLGDGFLTRLLLSSFPLYHPAGKRAIALTVIWLLMFAATVYAARRHYMTYGGGKLSPVLDIGEMHRVRRQPGPPAQEVTGTGRSSPCWSIICGLSRR